MQTRVAEMLGAEFPIGAFSHRRDVVAAIANAGEFGVLAAVAHSPNRQTGELTWIELRDEFLDAASPAMAQWTQGYGRVLMNWAAAQPDSKSVRPTVAVEIDVVAEFLDAGGLCGELVEQ